MGVLGEVLCAIFFRPKCVGGADYRAPANTFLESWGAERWAEFVVDLGPDKFFSVYLSVVGGQLTSQL